MALAGAPTLLKKEFRQHGVAMLLLGGGFVATMMLAHAQNQQAAFAMSPLQVLLLSITLVLPLIAFIMGNRLIASEYLGNTRQFVEALPIRPIAFLIIKYCLGLFFVAALALASIAYAWLLSDSGDALDRNLLNIILVKTLSVVFLVWSVVFCFSFFGSLRFALYVLVGLVILTLLSYPSFDHSEFGPFALLDQSVFAFEREQMPIKAAAQTVFMGLVFTLAGFALPLMRDGSLVESLSKPVNRGNMVVLGVIAVGVFVTMGALVEKWQKEDYQFSSDHVVSEVDPPISILYLKPQYIATSQRLLDSMRSIVGSLQDALQFESLPTVRVALDTDLSPTDLSDIRFSSADGVLIRANYLQYDSYSMAVLQTNALHQLIQATSRERRTFEPYHWLLDGFTRWWVEKELAQPAHKAELLARANYSLNYLEAPVNLSSNWQWIAEAVDYPSAEALSYTALLYLEQQHGADKILELARVVLAPSVENNIIGVFKDRRVSMNKTFSKITGQELNSFFDEWRTWLQEQKDDAEVAALLSQLPDTKGVIKITAENGVQTLTGHYEGAQLSASAVCNMQHVLISPFDYEIGPISGYHDKLACSSLVPVHNVSSYYAAGDRVFVALSIQLDALHQSVRVGNQRMVVE